MTTVNRILTPLPRRGEILPLAVLAILLAGCAQEKPAAVRAAAGTPVVLISIDTLRADHLPAWGYQGVATPAIDALARDGVLFENAYSPTPLTLPAHSTLLTGLLPGQHGVRDNVGYRLDRAKIESGELPHLARQLQKLGYATGAAVSSYVLDAKTGIATGFDFYDDEIELHTGGGLGGLQRPGGETLDAALGWLAGLSGKSPFLFVHFYEPHTPYEPPEPFASRYPSKYDGEIAAADALVGRLIAELEQKGLYDDAILLLFSDHGEGLGDHGEAEHGVLLYAEAIHVPLIVKLPGARLAGTRVKNPAGLFDVAPTVLELLGQPKAAGQTGVSLLSLLEDGAPLRRIYSETFYPRLHFGWSELFSLIDGKSHLIAGPEPELFDLAADPRERKNVLQDQRRLYAELAKELEAYDRELAAPSAVDDETQKAMAALGYVGSGSLRQGPLPDPRGQIAVLDSLQEGFRLQSRKDHAGAAAALRAVLAKSPAMADAWEALARSLTELGDHEGAIAAYKKALEAGDGAPHVAVELAGLLFQMERYEDAEAHARLALRAHASFAHGILARILVRRGRLEEAEKEARAALEGEKLRIGPLVTLAEVQQAAGRPQEALASLAEARQAYAARQQPDPELLRGLHLIQGKIEADQGDAAAAEASLRKEIELFPDDPRAYSHLALLCALTGRGAEVGPLLKAMVEATPGPAGYAEAVRALRVLGNRQEAESLLAYARKKYPESEELRRLAGA